MESNNVSIKSLRDRAKEFSVRLPFMDGCNKGEMKDLIGQVTTISDFGFLPDDRGEHYVVFVVKERSGKFYFGGQVLTDQMMQLDQEGYGTEIRESGLPMLLTEKKSRNNRGYISVEFYPD